MHVRVHETHSFPPRNEQKITWRSATRSNFTIKYILDFEFTTNGTFYILIELVNTGGSNYISSERRGMHSAGQIPKWIYQKGSKIIILKQ
jgi:hypothetical protein